MLWIFVIFLITQLPHSEALQCFAGEYEINGECCPMCSAGSRVVKHCRPSSSTTCMPCVDDTYTEHPNGLTECMRCKVCDAGARLMIKEKCTYTKNTVCGCAPGDFCPHAAGLDCEMCRPYTVCPPGYMVKKPGTEFLDNVCEVCPEGTFSATNMLRTCQPWTRCEEEGMREQKAGTATSDAICVRRGLSTTAIALIIVLALSLLSAFAGTAFFLWRRRKRKDGGTPAQETGGEQNEEVVENSIQTNKKRTDAALPVQETTKNSGTSTLHSTRTNTGKSRCTFSKWGKRENHSSALQVREEEHGEEFLLQS
ncbi:tumor necrosis factor receptor superfamily member 14 isoform X2 [Trachemys scripta elegans]|uniref:tumor necrosis factor receptor superfamily member 14 isoform X2 n=1 Tax=Trachemys scripta elegans TaxID=31138 RepID=UPI001551A833|nr:tumor necrosis factor receptor superfamily member 14 isoform X2 [Trachemys scripta elegans]